MGWACVPSAETMEGVGDAVGRASVLPAIQRVWAPQGAGSVAEKTICIVWWAWQVWEKFCLYLLWGNKPGQGEQDTDAQGRCPASP